MARTTVSPEQLILYASRLEEHADAYAALSERFCAEAAALDGVWKGADSNAFRERIEETRLYLGRMADKLRENAALLRAQANNYASQIERNTAAARALKT